MKKGEINWFFVNSKTLEPYIFNGLKFIRVKTIIGRKLFKKFHPEMSAAYEAVNAEITKS